LGFAMVGGLAFSQVLTLYTTPVSTQSENVPSFCKMRMSPFALRRRGAGLHPAAAWQRLLAALEWLERFVTIKS